MPKLFLQHGIITHVPYVSCICFLQFQQTKDGYYVTITSGTGGGDAFGMRFLDPHNYAAGWNAGEYSYLKPSWLKPLGYGCASQAGE